MFNLNRLKNQDWAITIVTCILILIGLVVIYSATYNAATEAQGAGSLAKHLILVILGLVIYQVIALIDISWIRTRTILAAAYFVILALLVYVKFFGQTIANTNRWIDVGFFSIQPSEYSKIVLILVTAGIFTINEKVLSRSGFNFNSRKRNTENLKVKIGTKYPELFRYLLSTVLAMPIIILTLIQPSLGNAVIISIIWATMLFIVFSKQGKLLAYLIGVLIISLGIIQLFGISREGSLFKLAFNPSAANIIAVVIFVVAAVTVFAVSKLQLAVLITVPIISISLIFGTIIGWNNVLTPYQRQRIDIFVQGPEADPLGTGYQVRQSKVAVGSGRLFGRGFLQGTQSSLNVLTQAHTDFAFAALSEQFGFIGGVLLIILYIILLMRILKIGLDSTSEFGTVVCLGIATMLLVHIFINIGMNIGKLPVTGIPLPLISYGGSSVFVTLISLGIVQSVASSKRAVDISDNLMLLSRD